MCKGKNRRQFKRYRRKIGKSEDQESELIRKEGESVAVGNVNESVDVRGKELMLLIYTAKILKDMHQLTLKKKK